MTRQIQKIGIPALLVLLTTGAILSANNLTALFSTPQASAQTSDNRKAEAYRLLQQGIEQYQTSQFEAALQSWQQALTIYREIKDRQGEGNALGNLGLTYYSLGDYSKAIDYHQQSLAILREIKDRQGEGAALGNLGLAYYFLGAYSKAIDYHQQRLAIAREIKDRQGEGAALGNLGLAYYSLGDYSKAIEYHQQRLAIAREIKDRQGEGASLGNLGLAYYSLGDYSKAIDYHQQSLPIAREIKDRKGEGAALGNLGLAYYSLGDYSKAIDYYQQSLAILREIKDRQGEGATLGNLGLAYDFLGDYTKAIEYHQQRLAIVREIKDRQGEGASLRNLGFAYYSLGDYSKALEYHQQSLAIAREIKDRQGEGAALGNLGLAYYSLVDYSKAIDYHQQSLAILREIKDRQGEGASLGNLGLAYYFLGDYSKAIDYHQQRLAIVREIKDRQGEGASLGNLGLAYYSLGDYSKALNYFQQHLAIAREIKDRQGEAIALNNTGLMLYKQGNLTLAETTLINTIEVWESLRIGLNDVNKISIFETQAKSYLTLQQILIAQNKTDTALEIAERGRARAFIELLTQRLAASSTERTTIDPPNIEQIKQIARTQNSTLVEYSIIYDDFKVQNKQQLQESELYIWVIKSTGVVTFRKSDLKPLWQQQNTSLAELVTNSRESIGVRGRGFTVVARVEAVDRTKKLQQLHQLLIEPIADLLPANPNDRVTFIPQQELFLVPFAALQDARGKYLIEKHTILTAPAIQVLDLTRKQRQLVAGKDILVVGNPIMPKIGEPPQQLSNLPGAEAEALAIAKLLNTKAITGKNATKAAILPQLPQARIIHLATHGLLDDFKGLGIPGAIALAPSDNDDGLLTAGEILDLKLQAELIILSACDTGRGKVTGDGVIGLSRSLISAGVPSVIVSLWSVPDAPTAALMTEFYQNWQKNPDKAQALRQAMLTTKEKHPDPKDWAAFTAIGEAE